MSTSKPLIRSRLLERRGGGYLEGPQQRGILRGGGGGGGGGFRGRYQLNCNISKGFAREKSRERKGGPERESVNPTLMSLVRDLREIPFRYLENGIKVPFGRKSHKEGRGLTVCKEL